jgi:hypothetical protein
MKGHIGPQCKNKKKKSSVVLITVGEDDDEDDDGPTFMMTCEACTAIVDDGVDSTDNMVMFFKPNEVLIDCAAGQNIFNNPALVHCLHPVVDHHGVKGVDETASVLAVEAKGLFADVDCPVHVAKNAAANLLSQAMLLDAGCTVT